MSRQRVSAARAFATEPETNYSFCSDDVVSGRDLSTQAHNHSIGQGGIHPTAQDLATDTAESGSTSDVLNPNPLIPRGSPLNTPKDQKSRAPISDGALSIARKTFKSVEIGSGAIPIVGTYVGAAAKVGLAFVETLQVRHIASI